MPANGLAPKLLLVTNYLFDRKPLKFLLIEEKHSLFDKEFSTFSIDMAKDSFYSSSSFWYSLVDKLEGLFQISSLANPKSNEYYLK